MIFQVMGRVVNLWRYSLSALPLYFVRYYTSGANAGKAEFAWENVTVAALDVPSTDSFGRYYLEVGGYRYTASVAVVQTQAEYTTHKIYRGAEGVEPLGERS